MTTAPLEDRTTEAGRQRPAGAEPSQTHVGNGWGWWSLACACGLAAGLLAINHPLSPVGALLACAALTCLAFWRPHDWLLWVLPLMPIAGLATWTGWLTFEEFDLLILSTAAGVALHHARHVRPLTPSQSGADRLWLAWSGLALFACLVCVGVYRGLVDAGGWQWSWWHGYHEPMNPLRVGKSYFLALLLLVLWTKLRRVDPQQASARWNQGMAGVLATTGLMVLWERAAFTGLLNFSSDYRATALFWEMHVGGAALDVALVMCLAFVASCVRAAKGWPAWLAWIAVALLAAYASAVTFSRVVYVGAPLVVVLWWCGQALAARSAGAALGPAISVPAVLLTVAFAMATLFLFPLSGYRGLLALLGCVAVLLVLAGSLARLSWGRMVGVSLFALLMAALVYAAAALVPKLTYGVYALALCAAAAVVLRQGRLQRALLTPLVLADLGLLALYISLAVGVGAVSIYWRGEHAAMASGVLAAVLCLAPFVLRACRPDPWPRSPRWQVSVLALLATLGLVIGVLSGGAYMGGRWAHVQQDLGGRADHWRQALSQLKGTGDWLWGKGIGRYASSSLLFSDIKSRAGDYRWQADPAGGHLVLTGGRHVIGWGEMLRVSQRVSEPGGPVNLSFRARTDVAVALHFEICEKHLLYNLTCILGKRSVPAQSGVWQQHTVRLQGANLPQRGSWVAPKLLVFSMAVESSGGRVEIDAVQAMTPLGEPLLHNGSFEKGLSHWYSTSDHLHLQWHAKNLFVHLLFEQGLMGLGLFLGLFALALWRLSLGALRADAMAAPLAAALCGMLVVGLGDSVLDMPRIAVLVYLSLGVALVSRAGAGAGAGAGPVVGLDRMRAGHA